MRPFCVAWTVREPQKRDPKASKARQTFSQKKIYPYRRPFFS
jgi:hypothetical protein